MSPSHVLEPTYTAIKGWLIAGLWPARQRLEAARIADELGVSITPVRDSLSRLVGERLAELMPGEGFRVPYRSEQDLQEIFSFNLQVLRLAISVGSAKPRRLLVSHASDFASRTDALFDQIGADSGNGELQATIRSLNDRLYATRRIDSSTRSDIAAEVAALERLAARGDKGLSLLEALERYHRERIGRVGLYVRELNRGLENASPSDEGIS